MQRALILISFFVVSSAIISLAGLYTQTTPKDYERSTHATSPTAASLLEEELASIRNDLDYYKLAAALQRAELLKERYPELLSLRELLFTIYLQLGILEQSAAQLAFIKKRRNDERTRYLAALFELEKVKKTYLLEDIITLVPADKQNSTILPSLAAYAPQLRSDLYNSIHLARELLESNRQFSAPHLLLCEALVLLGRKQEASKHANFYRALRGEDRKWFQCQANVLLSTTPFPQEQLLSLLERYRKHYARDVIFNKIAAQYYIYVNDLRRALKSVEEALYFNSQQPYFIRSKIKLLYSLKEYTALRDFLATYPGQTPSEMVARQYLATLSLFRAQQVNPNIRPSVLGPGAASTYWTVNKDFSAPTLLYKPLAELLALEKENEVVRFFYEALVRANTPFTYPRRLSLARYHKDQGERYLAGGNIAAARAYYLRALSLAPQDLVIRSSYLKLLKNTAELKSYQEELAIVADLKDAAEAAPTAYKDATRQALIAQRTRGDLEEKYAITRRETQQTGTTVLIIPPPYSTLTASVRQPIFAYSDLHAFIEGMLRSMLVPSPALKVSFENNTELEQALQMTRYDAILFYDFSVYNESLQLTYTLSSPKTRNVFHSNTIVFSGNERFFKAFLTLKLDLEQHLIRRGQILRLDGHKLVLSLGKRQIAQPLTAAPMFYIEKGSPSRAQKELLGPFPIRQLEERVALGEVRDYFLLKDIQVGDNVIMDARAGSFSARE